MSRRPRREFTEEFKRDAVELVGTSGRGIQEVAKDLDLTKSALERWVKAAQAKPSAGAMSANEELAKLREENRVLKMERDFLKKAAAFFAKQSQ